ncbi:facilitated trehalose transporter Tret1 [Neodiprion pinetum]|uniref:facilitated trehalose transporter Tret1 n=1 Tax=Neodiprion pinetum TaxID=441929 RepID=UPI001EDF4E7F|nr:facilitated trehalose transporter Tret1-like [Neodiprion pinetum]
MSVQINEDRTSNNPRHRVTDQGMGILKQYLAAFVASLGGFSLGVSLGWNSSSSESMKNYVNADSLALGLVGGIFNLGACVGLMLLPLVLRAFSRIGAMMMTVPILFLGWSCIVFAGQTVPLMLFGRILCGFSGTFCVLVPIYVTEIADRRIRGCLLALFQVLINLGIMFAYLVAELTELEKTIWLYSLICTVTTAPVAFAILLPESPTYHLLTGNENRAKISLQLFRGKDHPELNSEMEELKQLVAIKESKQVSLNTLREKQVRRSLLGAFGLMMMHQFSGIGPFIFYTLALFKVSGSADITSSQQTLVVGAAQLVSSILAAVLIDILGRKVLLVASSSLMGIFMFLLGWFFNVQQEDPEFADAISWMPLTWIALFFAAFSLGVGPIAWVLLGEIFPVHVKLEAAITMAVLNWLASLSLTLLFGEMLDGMGEAKTMWFFGVMSWAGAIFTLVFIKETKLRSLIDLQDGAVGIPEDSSEL